MPSKYTKELGKEIAERYAAGEPISSICNQTENPHMPSKATFVRWSALVPEFAELLNHSRASRADMLADEVISISDSDDNPHKARNRIEARRWAASVLNPVRYSTKVQVDYTEKLDVSAALESARARLPLPVRDQLLQSVPETRALSNTYESESTDDSADDDECGSIFE